MAPRLLLFLWPLLRLYSSGNPTPTCITYIHINTSFTSNRAVTAINAATPFIIIIKTNTAYYAAVASTPPTMTLIVILLS